jgi:hypothetical protein
MKRQTTRERFVVVLEDLGATDAEGSTDCRLKRLLKLTLRGFRFRCVEIRPAGELPEGSDEQQEGDPC